MRHIIILWAMSALTLPTASAFAEPPAPPSDPTPAKTKTAPKVGANKAYRSVERLRQLEADAARTRRVGVDAALDPELLAPYLGAHTALLREQGRGPQLGRLPAQVTRGAQILDAPQVQERLSKSRVLDLALPTSHPTVRSYVDFFDGRGKGTLSKWLRKMARYETMIRETLRAEGLPEDLIYVSMIESGFSPFARSPAAAVGLWQFISSTGRDMGLRIDRWVDERRDPVKSTRAAARYLGYLHRKYNSWALALAAYNGGAGRVNKSMRELNSNNYWELVARGGLHSESRKYVAKVMVVAMVSKHPDLFGFRGIKRAKPLAFEVVRLDRPMRLSLVARAVGCDVDDLRSLNPELLSASTPPDVRDYELRVPRGAAARFVARIDKIATGANLPHITHDVAFGENLDLIARHHKIPTRVIRVVNGMGRRARLSYGQTLVLPKKALGTWTPENPKEKPVALLPRSGLQPSTGALHLYVVNRGDSLRALARGFGLHHADLALWHQIDTQARLKPGQILQIYTSPERASTTLALRAPDTYQIVRVGSETYKKRAGRSSSKRSRRRVHRVRSGDSLWMIARRYKTTVKKLKRANPKLRRKNTLRPGMKLIIRR